MNSLHLGSIFYSDHGGFTIKNTDTYFDGNLFLNYNLNIKRPIISAITGLPSDNTQIGYKTKIL
jgi:hypothetical protein